MYVRVLAVLGTLLAGWWVFQQAASVSASQVARESSSPFLITRWTTENGLPQNSVTSIVQTPDGYLWLGTFGGLARFDGVHFTIFNTSNTPALPSNRITALHVGRDGTLWIGAESGEITRFHNGGFNFFARIQADSIVRQNSLADAPHLKNIRAIYEDRSGTIWVGATNVGLHCYIAGDPARAEFYDERQGLPSGQVQSICEDRDGRLWICATLGLAVLQELPSGPAKANSPPQKFKVELTRADPDWLFKIRAHPEGGLWLLARRNLNRFYDGQLTPYLSYPFNANLAVGMTELATGELLLSDFANHLFKIGQSGLGTIDKVELDQIGQFHTLALMEDREGNLWLGTTGEGLLRLRRRRVTMFYPVGKRPDASGPLLEDGRGDFWFGAQSGVFRQSADGLMNHFAWGKRENEGDWRVNALYRDCAGAVWIGRTKGLAQYRDGHFNLYALPNIGMISAITEDRSGQLWLGTWKGLVRFRDGQATLYSERDGLVDNDVKFLFGDSAGAVWVGTPGGLSRFENGVFTNYTTREGLSNNYVRDVYEDRDGALWLATYGGGLNRLRKGRFARVTTNQGLFDDFISRILADDEDRFWLLGNRGVFQVSRQTLNQVADGQRSSMNCVVYDKADGMDPSEGQGGFQPAGWRGRDGRLWFPTIRGIAIVDPHLSNSLPPAVHIESVSLDGAQMDARHPIEIPPGKGNLEIHYTGLSLGKPEQVRFSFRLSGLDEQWQDVGTRRTAYFPQLPSGRYSFSVRALSPEGVWSEQAAALDIFVKPHFWQTAWFLSLIAMGAAGLGLAGYRGRMMIYRRRILRQEAFARQLIETQEHERERIAAELHDGLSQSLVIIKNRALSALKVPDDQERALEQLKEIAEASTHTIDEVKEIIYDLHPLQLDRLGLTVALGEMLGEVAEAHGLEISSELDDINNLLSKESANNLYRIVQESLNNIIKHAKAGKVAVLLKLHEGFLALTVKDDGQGFVPGEARTNARRDGFGLAGIVERARLLGGESLIESAPGCGTTVSVRLPLKEQRND